MPESYSSVVKRPLHYWVVGKNRRLQFILVITAIVAALANVVPLEMQKRIVDGAIASNSFDLLVLYCAIYLVAVTSATALKYLINVLQNIIGQRTVCEMRDAVYRNALTLPLGFYRKTQPGLVVSALTTELSTAGVFVGMAVAVPATNLLMLAAFAGYLFWLNPPLAALSIGIYPAMLMVLPMLQKRVNRYNRMRVDATRRMSSKAGEAISGIHEIHANNTYSKEGDKFAGLIKNLSKIRVKWNLYRHGVKRINSLFTNFSRFLVFAVGGYLAIQGRLELGALVAFLSAQDKFYDPWKELINFYQAYKTAQVTYNRTMDYFDVKPDHALVPEGRNPYALKGDIEVKNLNYVTDEGVQLLSDIQLNLEHGEHLALVGFSGSGKSTLAKCIGQLYPYTGGKIQIDQKEVSQLSKADMARTIGFVSQDPYIFEGSIQENLLYAFWAQENGVHGDGTNGTPGLDDQILTLQQTGLFTDVLRFGLDRVLDEERHGDLVDQILKLREKFQQEHRDGLADLIEFYDPNQYLYCSSVAENLVYGESLEDAFQVDKLIENDQFILFLGEAELLEPLLHLGIQLTEATLQFYDNRATEDESLEDVDLISMDEIDEYKTVLYKAKTKHGKQINEKIRKKILRVALSFIPNKHKHVRLPDQLASRIIKERTPFKEKMGSAAPYEIKSCELSDYLYSQSILTNILFGKVRKDTSGAEEKINAVINQLLIEKDFLEDIAEMGLQHEVGRKGANLSGGQQQKLAIARALIKNPSVLIMDEATSGLDNESQDRIQQLLEDRWKDRSTLLAVVHRLDIIKNYDKVGVMKDGKILETGTYEELMDQQGILAELVNKKQ